MRVRSLATLFAVAGAAVTLAACGATDSTSPTAASHQVAVADSANHNLLGTLLGGSQQIDPLLRKTALSAPITVSKSIGILGGTIAIPQAGMSIIIPPLAIPATKTITVTALAGNKVAYEFAPHGLKFTLPLIMTQDYSKTNASGGLLDLLSIKLGYFQDAGNPTAVTELLPVQINLLNTTAITTVWHFSGYIFASGRGDDSF